MKSDFICLFKLWQCYTISVFFFLSDTVTETLTVSWYRYSSANVLLQSYKALKLLFFNWSTSIQGKTYIVKTRLSQNHCFHTKIHIKFLDIYSSIQNKSFPDLFFFFSFVTGLDLFFSISYKTRSFFFICYRTRSIFFCDIWSSIICWYRPDADPGYRISALSNTFVYFNWSKPMMAMSPACAWPLNGVPVCCVCSGVAEVSAWLSQCGEGGHDLSGRTPVQGASGRRPITVRHDPQNDEGSRTRWSAQAHVHWGLEKGLNVYLSSYVSVCPSLHSVIRLTTRPSVCLY